MFARTPRLTLRPAWVEDACELAAAMAHEDVVTRLADVPWPYGIAEARDFTSRDRDHRDPVFLIFAHENARPALVGGIALNLSVVDVPDLGYWLTPTAWGRGYATEAGRAVVAIARDTLRLRRLRSGHFIDNPRSGRVLQKLGFVPTGLIEHRACRARGTCVATATYTLDLAQEEPTRMAA